MISTKPIIGLFAFVWGIPDTFALFRSGRSGSWDCFTRWAAKMRKTFQAFESSREWFGMAVPGRSEKRYARDRPEGCDHLIL
jgi:hypothetical protein